MTIDPDQYAELLAAVRVLQVQQAALLDKITSQDEILDELKSKADQGKGALWMLLSLGSAVSVLVGFLAANAKTIFHAVVR